MLHDQSKDITLQGLIDWLETKDPQAHYNYGDSHSCLLAQFYQAKGYPYASVSAVDVYANGGFSATGKLPKGFNDIAVFEPETFGAALARAKEYRDTGKITRKIRGYIFTHSISSSPMPTLAQLFRNLAPAGY